MEMEGLREVMRGVVREGLRKGETAREVNAGRARLRIRIQGSADMSRKVCTCEQKTCTPTHPTY